MTTSTWLKQVEKELRHRLLYDVYVVSYPKCGRTWLNSILLHYVRRHYEGISEPIAFRWAPPMARYTWHRRFPNICFTHGIVGNAKPYQELTKRFDPAPYIAKRSVLLVRDPRDVVVSYFHHAMKKRHKNQLPSDMSLSDFLRDDAFGVRPIVTFYNLWAPVIEKHPNVSLCRYEDLKADTFGAVRSLLQFFGVLSIDEKALKWAIEVNDFEKLQAREKAVKQSRGAEIDEDGLRVRKGKVGGYRDAISQADIHYSDQFIEKHLADLYEYKA